MPSLIVRLRYPVGKNTSKQDHETRFDRGDGTSAEREGHQVDVLSQCMKNGGAVTINLGIYQDGSVDPKAVDVLKEVPQRIRKEQK